MGLQPFNPDDWIEIGHNYDAALDERERLLRDHRHLCILSMPEVDPIYRSSRADSCLRLGQARNAAQHC